MLPIKNSSSFLKYIFLNKLKVVEKRLTGIFYQNQKIKKLSILITDTI